MKTSKEFINKFVFIIYDKCMFKLIFLLWKSIQYEINMFNKITYLQPFLNNHLCLSYNLIIALKNNISKIICFKKKRHYNRICNNNLIF